MAASAELLPSYLGNPIEFCIVTNDYKRTLTALSHLGFGPWRIYTCSPHNTTNQTYHGVSTTYTLRFCYADASPSGAITYEVIQPLSGPSIFQDFLDKGGEGLHHIAYDCHGIAMEERVKMFRERGLEPVQEGCWMGGGKFAFWRCEGAGTWVETIEIEEGFEWPEPEEWFPAAAAPAANAPAADAPAADAPAADAPAAVAGKKVEEDRENDGRGSLKGKNFGEVTVEPEI